MGITLQGTSPDCQLALPESETQLFLGVALSFFHSRRKKDPGFAHGDGKTRARCGGRGAPASGQ